MGRELAQPQRRAADDEFGAHVLGADLGGAIRLGNERQLDLACGWAGSTSTPTPAGRSRRRSPARPRHRFTVYGATPTRDAAIVGFSASDQHRGATQLYLRYDGELASGTDNHALTAGLRMSW